MKISILIFGSVLILNSTIAQAEFDLNLHKDANNKCQKCHKFNIDKWAGMTEIEQVKKCGRCHSTTATDINKAQEKLALKKVKNSIADAGEGISTNMYKTAKGMRYPQYYQGTRIGDEPNEMILIPAGEFIMGTDDRLPDEGPKYKPQLPAYYIDKFEVTNLQYKKFNDQTKRRSPTHFRNRTFPQGKADHPVTYVTWDDAHAYCQWAGKRLPTDQEWEKAARGIDGKTYPWGDTLEIFYANTPMRWKELGVFGDTTPVGAFEKGVSEYGLFDMSGNVWEWTASWYTAYPNNKVHSESYGERYKTLKGGSWFDCSFYKCGISAPVFNRAFFAKRTKNDSFGFRCAKTAN